MRVVHLGPGDTGWSEPTEAFSVRVLAENGIMVTVTQHPDTKRVRVSVDPDRHSAHRLGIAEVHFDDAQARLEVSGRNMAAAKRDPRHRR